MSKELSQYKVYRFGRGGPSGLMLGDGRCEWGGLLGTRCCWARHVRREGWGERSPREGLGFKPVIG